MPMLGVKKRFTAASPGAQGLATPSPTVTLARKVGLTMTPTAAAAVIPAAHFYITATTDAFASTVITPKATAPRNVSFKGKIAITGATATPAQEYA